MKKFINAVDNIRIESLHGLAAAHSDILLLNEDPVFLRRRVPAPKTKVALISGGGSGHEPLHGGFVGRGMLDAACPGFIFTSPSADQIQAAVNAVAGDSGTLLIVKNFAGDVMNFEIAGERLTTPRKMIVVADDVSGEISDAPAGRRGVAGTVILHKIVGAAAEAGLSLEDCSLLAEKVNARTRSIGVSLTSCTVPAVGRPTFDIGENEMEIGVGIHGERGRSRRSLASADEIMDDMVNAVLASLTATSGDALLVMINGFGGTPLQELYLMFDAARRKLLRHDYDIKRCLVGNFVASLDMAGCSLTIALLNEQLMHYWDAPVHTAALRWHC